MNSTKFKLQNYVFDQLGESGDPLIKLVAQTPVHSNYKAMRKEVRDGYIIDTQRYMSFQHQALFVFLHKLGLRGRI